MAFAVIPAYECELNSDLSDFGSFDFAARMLTRLCAAFHSLSEVD